MPDYATCVIFTHGPTLTLNSNIRLSHLNMNGCLHQGPNSTVSRGKMLHILDILLHKCRLYSSFYIVMSYTNLSLMMSGQKIAIQNFPTNCTSEGKVHLFLPKNLIASSKCIKPGSQQVDFINGGNPDCRINFLNNKKKKKKKKKSDVDVLLKSE